MFDKFGSAGGLLIKYPVEGCTLEGSYSIKGAARCKFLSSSESVVQKCEFSATSGSELAGGSYPIVLTAVVNMELAGANKGQVWAAKAS